MFYADWSPHYEWLEPTIKEYEQQVEAVIKINITENENLQFYMMRRMFLLLF